MPTPKSLNPNYLLGQSGETAAGLFLNQKNWQIWQYNFRHGQDEIDLIAFDPDHQEIVFVEVKTRQSDYSGQPSQAYDQRKLNAQARVAEYYLKSHPTNYDFRFDLITILPDKIEHYENITWP